MCEAPGIVDECMVGRNKLPNTPFLIDGDIAIDERGIVRFCNGFDFQKYGIRRMYSLENHEVGYVRAWHGHEKEAKFTTVVSGVAMIGITPLEVFCIEGIVTGSAMIDSKGTMSYKDEWRGNHFQYTQVRRFTLSSLKPQILYIPPGYANGYKALTPNTQVVHFSTVTIEEAKGDDLRWPWDAFGAEFWEVEGR